MSNSAEETHFPNRLTSLPLIEKWRSQGYKVIFTSGTFDLLHWGHVSYLDQAANLIGSHQKTTGKTKLVVAINSDASVKQYKDPSRPIQSEKDRLRVISHLDMVDAAFLFNETNNRENILAIKPNFYVKAADYQKSQLTSAKYLEDWGGEVVLIPFEKGYSTTKIIEKITTSHPSKNPPLSDSISNFNPITNNPISNLLDRGIKPAVFLDRDGVINREVEYLHRPEEFELLPKVIEGLVILSNLGYRLIIVTTQAGIGLGYFTEADFFKVNRRMLSLFHQSNILIDKIYFCPHAKSDQCACRKPNTALLERAEKEAQINLAKSFFIGDKTSDIEAGKRMNLTTLLVSTGHAGRDGEYDTQPHHRVKDLVAAAEIIKSYQP